MLDLNFNVLKILYGQKGFDYTPEITILDNVTLNKYFSNPQNYGNPNSFKNNGETSPIKGYYGFNVKRVGKSLESFKLKQSDQRKEWRRQKKLRTPLRNPFDATLFQDKSKSNRTKKHKHLI